MRKKNEKGFALVLSLVLLLVMSLMAGGLIVITSGDHKSNNTSDQYQQAFYVAETGLIQAEKTIVNQYLGPWMKVDDIVDPGSSASAEDTAAYNTFKAEAEANKVEGGLFRNTRDRSMPTNTIVMEDERATPCYNSFRNIVKINTNVIPSAYFKVTHHKYENFGELIQPIFDQLKLDGMDDEETPDVDESTTAESPEDEIIKEEKYLKRYEYEYFMVNVGTAPYKGTGSSIKKTSSDTGSSGTAYKLYACGIFYGKPPRGSTINHTGVAQIIIPLESLIVMPN